MTADLQQLVSDCDRLGYALITYHRGCFYIAGVGVRDVPWCKRVVRLNIQRKGRKA